MTLTIGTAPFGVQSAGEFNFNPDPPKNKAIYFEDSPRRVSAVFNGERIADSSHMKMLHETGLLPVYYFPLEDVRKEFLEKTDHSTHCPVKGDAVYWSVRVGDRVAENAIWSYPEPLQNSPHISGYAAIDWHSMDHWYEEDEEITVHPRDPYHRVDVRESTRHVRVMVNGELLAETDRPRLLFETGLPIRYYVPEEDVNKEFLKDSYATTGCAYKGTATYWSVKAGGDFLEDVVWTYRDPLPEGWKIRDHLCFYNEKVDTEVDGELEERPLTQWS